MGWNPFSWTKQDVIDKGLIPTAAGGGTGRANIDSKEGDGGRAESGDRLNRAQHGDPSGMTTAEAMAADPYNGTSWSGSEAMKPLYDLSPNQHYDSRAFMYGRDPNGADQATQMALQTGAGAQATGQQLESRNFGIGQQLQNRAPLQGNWAQQTSQLNNAASFGNTLAGLETTQGPSAAQAQLQAGTNAAMGSQVALARSGRGFGGGAAATGLAQQQLGQLGAANANQSAVLRAQEDAAWRGRQAANLGNAAGIQTAVASQFGQQAGADLSAGVTGRGQNDAAALGWAGQGQDAWKFGVGANLSGQNQATGIRGMEMSGGQALADRQLRAWAAEHGFDLQQQQMDNQQNAAYIGAGATTLAALAALSDVRAKTNIVPSGKAGADFARGGVVQDEEFDAAHPGIATSFLTEQGRANYDRNDALRLKHEAAGREFAEYGDDGLGKRSPRYQANAQFQGDLGGVGPGGRGSSAMPLTPMQAKYLGKPSGGGGGESGAPAMASTFPPEARPDTSRPLDMDTLDASALDAVRNAPGSFYDYKDPEKPGADARRHYGPMAQDLAKTPAGASAVVKQPDGSLGVDTGRLSLVNTSALSEQQKQLDELAAQLEAFRTSPSAVQPDQIYGGRR